MLCEKPLATTVEEAHELLSLAASQKLRNCVCHNLRFYPMVQQMRRMRDAGDLGEILLVHGTYFQDWLLYDTDWNWRVDPKSGGPSRTMADIGSHWFDMAEHVTGLRVTSLCADLQTFHRTRKQPKHSRETFANKSLGPEDYVETPVTTEDCGSVIFRMGERARGSVTASPGFRRTEKPPQYRNLRRKSSVARNPGAPRRTLDRPSRLPNQLLLKDPSLLNPAARPYTDLPGGHSEGYDDTFKQIFRRFYSLIPTASTITPAETPDYPQFADGLRQLVILNAVLASHQKRSWIDLPH